MILHIPHSSTVIPDDVIFDKDITEDLKRMTDWRTDELFSYSSMETIIFPYSRLFCDVERFARNESMEQYGHGICYTKDSFGNQLRSISISERMEILENYYWPHHRKLLKACNHALTLFDQVVIVDCHSFSDEPLPHEIDKTERPDFCIGVDEYHTPDQLIDIVGGKLATYGYSVKINSPFSGTIVPIDHYRKTHQLKSIMIEVNRKLYMNSEEDFLRTKSVIKEILDAINSYEQGEYTFRLNG